MFVTGLRVLDILTSRNAAVTSVSKFYASKCGVNEILYIQNLQVWDIVDKNLS